MLQAILGTRISASDEIHAPLYGIRGVCAKSLRAVVKDGCAGVQRRQVNPVRELAEERSPLEKDPSQHSLHLCNEADPIRYLANDLFAAGFVCPKNDETQPKLVEHLDRVSHFLGNGSPRRFALIAEQLPHRRAVRCAT
jgi:hypothetical protein